MATTDHPNKTLLHRVFDALNEEDRETFAELHRPDAVVHVGDQDVHGIDTIVDHEFAYFDAFPDLVLTLDTVLAEDDLVAARWTIVGTHQGTFQGIEPTGERIETSVMGIFRFQADRIAEAWLVADGLGLRRQLGVHESTAT